MIHNMNYLLGAIPSKDTACFIPRTACLCNAGHTLAATRALEQLLGIRIPESARLIRNIVHCIQNSIDHLTSFYLFYANDWFNLGSALRASPEKTAEYARNSNPRFEPEVEFYRAAHQHLATLAAGEGGRLFSVAGWDHPGYAAPPEASLLVYSHRQAAVGIRTQLVQAQRCLLGTAAADAIWHVGGLPTGAGLDAGSDPDLSPTARARCATLVRESRQFIEGTFLPDVLLVGRLYRDWAEIGRTDAFLSWGEFPGQGGDAPFYPGGVFTLQEAIQRRPATPELVSEEQEPIWPPEDTAHYRLRFGPGEAAYQWRNDDFRWFSAPRHAGQACEVGPLARLVGAYAHDNAVLRPLVDTALEELHLPLAALNSTLGRLMARGLETVASIRAVEAWMQDLDLCLARGDAVLQTPWEMPDDGEGVGLAELSRGALVHRIRLKNGQIVAHESLVPSLWNFSPRGSDGTPGPLEQALRSTPVANPANPIELLRSIDTFDPCNACVLRIEDRDTGRVWRSTVK